VKPPQIIAHRACPKDAPENSLEGIRVSIEQGADGVEIDLQVTLDQRPFLMHDRTMRRMVGVPVPMAITPSFVARRLRLKGSREPIPSLSDALDALPDHMFMAADVKLAWAVRPLLSEIRRRGIESRVLVWCNSARAAAWFVRRAPEVEVAYLKTALTPEAKRAFIAKAVALGTPAISAHWLAVDAEFIAAAHDHGLKVYSWHTYYELTPEKLRAGLDGLITDHPRMAREAYTAVL
jgi:glycerophosphoryl diester phosphodiesterase